MTMETVQCLGLGTPTGRQLLECTSPAEMAASRTEIMGELLRLDPTRLLKFSGLPPKKADPAHKAERLRLAGLELCRLLKRLARGVLGAPDTPDKKTVLIAKTDEEHSYSVQDYTITEQKDGVRRPGRHPSGTEQPRARGPG